MSWRNLGHHLRELWDKDIPLGEAERLVLLYAALALAISALVRGVVLAI